MKREYVVPDLLATMTADALFAGRPEPQAAAIWSSEAAFDLQSAPLVQGGTAAGYFAGRAAAPV